MKLATFAALCAMASSTSFAQTRPPPVSCAGVRMIVAGECVKINYTTCEKVGIDTAACLKLMFPGIAPNRSPQESPR